MSELELLRWGILGCGASLVTSAVVGAVQLVNKHTRDGFTEADESAWERDEHGESGT